MRRDGGAGREDGGNLLLLAGVILVLAFVGTAFTLQQVQDLEKQVSAEQDSAILSEYRFVRDKVGTTLNDAVSTSTNLDTFKDLVATVASNLKVTAGGKGYDLVVKLAADRAGLSRTEWSFTKPGWPDRYTYGDTPVPLPAPTSPTADKYVLWTTDGKVDWRGGTGSGWDGADDGVVWVDACIENPAIGCVQAAIVYLYFADSAASIEEFVAYSFNADA